MLVLDVLLVFVPEIVDRAQDGVGRGLPQAAEGRILDALAQFDQELDVALPAFAAGDPLQDFQHALGADPAGGALAAGFVLDELHEELGHVHHAGVFVHDDQAAGAHDRAQALSDS